MGQKKFPVLESIENETSLFQFLQTNKQTNKHKTKKSFALTKQAKTESKLLSKMRNLQSPIQKF